MFKTLSFIFILIVADIFASPQMPDYIVYKKDTIPTYNLILEQYLQKQNSDEGKLFGLSFRGSEDVGVSLNCWRGYQAIYEVINDKLYLTKIISCGELVDKTSINLDESTKKINKLFGDKVQNNRVLIDWFSGVINFPQKVRNNKQIRWDGIFYRIYEYETVLEFNNGSLIKQDEVHNYQKIPKAINRIDKNKVSDLLFKELKKMKLKNANDFDCGTKYFVTINEKGSVSKVRMLYSDKEIEKYYEKGEYDFCVEKMLNALKDLKFDIIKDKGRPISEDIYIEIWQKEHGKLENWTH